jgi:hypothetical protein
MSYVRLKITLRGEVPQAHSTSNYAVEGEVDVAGNRSKCGRPPSASPQKNQLCFC